jgi:2-hydroxychromene-2-carboxylate isomerase
VSGAVQPPLEIWFEFSSTYSYLTVMRAEAVLTAASLQPVWRPFLLGPILRQRGYATSPFVLDLAKGAHMWRDVERRAAFFDLPFVRPPTFPMNGLLAARAMTAALGEPWAGSLARAVMRAGFGRGGDIADPDLIREALAEVADAPDTWLERAGSDAVKAALRERTEEAARLGMFGAPHFRVGHEMFWGDDRLEEAVLWAQGRHPAYRRS